MRVILNRTPSIPGATKLPKMCAKPVGDVQIAPPWICTSPYNGCTKIPLTSEYSTPSGEILSQWFRVVHLVYKALRDFPECIHSLWEIYGDSHQEAVQVRTAYVRKFR